MLIFFVVDSQFKNIPIEFKMSVFWRNLHLKSNSFMHIY